MSHREWRTEGGRFTPQGRHIPIGLTFFAVLAMILGGMLGGMSSASAGAVRGEHLLAPSTPSAGPYKAVLENLSGEIAADIGHPLSLPITVTVNSTQKEGASTEAYAGVENASGGDSGTPGRCAVAINPLLYAHNKSAGLTKFVLAHEMFHCFEAMDYPTIAAFNAAPDWLIEGEAEWVGDEIEPQDDHWWDTYLLDIGTPLFKRSYDAVGFYSLMTQTGDDTWHLLDPMLKAGGNAAAFNVASTTTLQKNWASTYARESGFGQGWDAKGPGITDATYKPDTSVIHNGTHVTEKVAPYSNALIKFSPSAHVVNISPGTVTSRLHEPNGDTDNGLAAGSNEFCVTDCNACPEMMAMPKLPPGTSWLAISGDTTGATYSVVGQPDLCNESCAVGSWTVTTMTLTTSGYTFTGGEGTEVNIATDGTATADFSPGAVLGAAKFNGVETAKYALPDNPKELSGSFGVSDYDVSQATITVGGRSEPVDVGPGEGSFTCTGTTGLTLNFPAGANDLEYTMVRDIAPATTTP
jgi:hypothetical protein